MPKTALKMGMMAKKSSSEPLFPFWLSYPRAGHPHSSHTHVKFATGDRSSGQEGLLQPFTTSMCPTPIPPSSPVGTPCGAPLEANSFAKLRSAGSSPACHEQLALKISAQQNSLPEDL